MTTLAAQLRRAGVAERAIPALVARETAGGAPMPAAGALVAQAGRQAAKRPVRKPAPPLPIVLALPMPPGLANVAARSSRSGIAAHRARKKYLEGCNLRRFAGLVPREPPRPIERATLEVLAVVARPNDMDNLVARLKPVCDWLVSQGYLRDDGPDHLTWLGMPSQRVKRPGEPAHVVLTLQPLETP